MKALYYDCFAGISGDMNLAALIDLGLPIDHLKGELGKLGLESEYTIKVESVSKMGIVGCQVLVENHYPHEHGRPYGEIKSIIEKSTLSEAVKTKAIEIFHLIALAEAKIHGCALEKVHFHEVGAVDSIVDIVGAAIASVWFDVDEVIVSEVELGRGFVKCQHGLIPVPAPATLEILQKVPVVSNVKGFEMTTPTGAAILKALGSSYHDDMGFAIEKVGYGMGHREMDIPNMLRVMLVSKTDQKKKIQYLIETNIDDMTAERLAYAEEKLFQAGALDVFKTPIVMKKGRSAIQLSLLSDFEHLESVKAVLFKETTSIGVRVIEVEKNKLHRTYEKIQTPYGLVTLKRAFHHDELVNEKPEFEDCKALAEKHGVPISKIYEAVNERIKK